MSKYQKKGGQPTGPGIRTHLSRYAIRIIAKSDERQTDLAREYGVSRTTIERIRGKHKIHRERQYVASTKDEDCATMDTQSQED